MSDYQPPDPINFPPIFNSINWPPFEDGADGGGGGGLQGPQGTNGTSSQVFDYRTNTNITSGNPTAGRVLWNNATQNLATQINISHEDINNQDLDPLLALIQVGNQIIIQDRTNSLIYQKFIVSAPITIFSNSYVEVPVSIVASAGGNFANNHQIIVFLFLAGPVGAQGVQGAQGLRGFQGFQGNQGLQGVQGVQGLVGTQGATGHTGSSAPYFTGINLSPAIFTTQVGITGMTGATGLQGSTLDLNNISVGTVPSTTPNLYGSVYASSLSSPFTYDGDYYALTSISGNGKYRLLGGIPSQLYVSTDYGNTYTAKGYGGLAHWGGQVSTSGEYMVATCSNLVAFSSNYGTTFSTIFTGPPGSNAFCCANANCTYIYIQLNDKILRSINRGASFTEVLSFSGYNNYGITCNATGQYICAINISAGPQYFSTDYGATWSSFGNYSTGGFAAYSASGQYQYIAFGGSSYQRSDDYGKTFSPISTTVDHIRVSASGQNAIAGRGPLQALLWSNDYGKTFQSYTLSHTPQLISISGDGNYGVITSRTPNVIYQIDNTISRPSQSNLLLNAGNNFETLGSGVGATGFYATPIRGNTASNALYYNTTSKEITFGAVGVGPQGFQGIQGTTGAVGPTNTLYTQTYGATTTFDIDTNGALQKVVLTGSPTLALTISTNRTFVLLLEQGGSGSYTVTWFTTIAWAGGSPPTLTTTVGKTDAFGFIRTSAGNYLGYVIGLNA